MPPQVGQIIHNKYRLIRHIGDGGMGSVYEARHETLGATVALKFLHLEFSHREGLVQRFLQEARASARIRSPHVVRVADVDQTPDGDVFIVLEYLEGKTLQAVYEELYKSGRRLPYADGLDYAEQMLEGVEAAHQAGIVHRDLKPDNVMITVDAKGATVLKLLDFGIAKLKVMGASGLAPELTRPGVMMGTPEYMAPEQASSADTVDARADVFSLGVIIFEMLGGRRPVGGDDPLQLAAAYRSGHISQLADLVPGIAPGLSAAVHRAMAVEPAQRFATAAEMHAAIAPFAAAVRDPSPSRLRASGTIGVSESALSDASPLLDEAAHLRSGARALPNPPPPTAGDRVSLPAPRPLGELPSGGPQRPGGVAKTWPPDEEPPRGNHTVDDLGASLAPHIPPPPGEGSLAPHPVAHGDRTHLMSEPYPPVPLPSPSFRAPGAVRRRKRGTFSPLAVVVTAACVAGVVVGGAYLASTGGSGANDKDDVPPPASASPPASSAPADPSPPPPVEPPPLVTPPPGVGPAPRIAPRGPRAKPSPSGVPSADPSVSPSAAPPGLVLPFPLPNPFQPAAPPGSNTPPQQEPPPLFPLP